MSGVNLSYISCIGKSPLGEGEKLGDISLKDKEE